jgi:hypothetical protein
VPAAADDDVIVHRDPERLGGADDVLGDGDVCLRRGRVARRLCTRIILCPQENGGCAYGPGNSLNDRCFMMLLNTPSASA